ncbi:hypothetical protein [Alloscardovia sp. HMSC034E08]|uniref:hypothetical protein n=1 Tax=Alloscardovia sp. HMSC034E08 TaxID=1739413 RepID=UPI0008AE5E28|nr:hypothetical protein [Alloscardovia sp. HMSC034E08]OFR01165.1 hypothetical protein HMPREF2909_00110 [Alloscardovia sp. HMSC034E08]
MGTPIQLEPSSLSDNTLEDVHIQYGDVKIDLPNLADTGRLPLDIVQIGIVYAGGAQRVTQEQQFDMMSVFLAYFRRDYPQLVLEIDRKSGDKLADLERIVVAWVEGSKLDPKA